MLDTQILETSEYQIFTSLAFLFHLIIRPEFRLNGIPDALTQVCYSNGINIRHHSGSKQFSAMLKLDQSRIWIPTVVRHFNQKC